jgi:transcription initiation factor TFIID subunit 12
MKLTQLSQNLMKGMRLFQQNRQQALQQQQQQQQAQAAQGQPVQRTQSNNPQNLGQLLPAIQAKVNQLNFFLPPNTTPEQLQNWVPEARLRYGIALQKQEVGRARLADLRQQFTQRQSQGNMTQEDMQAFKNRQLAAEKLLREGSEFLEKFMEQQESFKMQQQNQQGMNQVSATQQPQQQAVTAPAAAPAATQAAASSQGAAGGTMQAPTPAPHTINSAVNAARNQAGQTAMSPSASQSGQPPAATAATPTSTTQPSQQPGQRAQPSSQQGTPGSQVSLPVSPSFRPSDVKLLNNISTRPPCPTKAPPTAKPTRRAT